MSAEIFGSGTVPQKSDTLRMLVVKDVNATRSHGGLSGTGSPEGSVTASPGATYVDVASGALWAKKTGTGATGWIQKVA